MTKKQNKNSPPDLKSIEKLLNDQTLTIIGAVDERLAKTEAKMNKKLIEMEIRINQRIFKLETKFDGKIEKMEERINRKFDKLTTTLDNFLKRMTDMEDEFEVMKLDIIRLKQVIREKIGVNLI